MKRLIIFLFAIFSVQGAFGSENSAKDMAQKKIQSINQFEIEAEEFSSFELAQKINNIQEMLRSQRNPNESLFSGLDNPESNRFLGYVKALKKRRKAGEVEAAFQYGIYEIKICMGMQKYAGDFGQTVSTLCKSAFDSLKLAADSNDPRAMASIALIYEEGLGVSSSKYVAADWYIKAAKNYRKKGNREESLQNLERALAVVPDHPSALQLRTELFRE